MGIISRAGSCPLFKTHASAISCSTALSPVVPLRGWLGEKTASNRKKKPLNLVLLHTYIIENKAIGHI